MRVIGLRAVAALVVLASAAYIPMARSQTRLAVPSYQNPGNSVWKSWDAAGSAALGIMIVDLDNGDDMSYHSNIDTAIQQTRKKGIHVLGYTYTDYGARNPTVIHQRIDALYQNYLVDGIFFDQAPTDCNAANSYYPNNFLYYQELTNYVRQKVGARITVLNPGINSPNDCWMSITNILMNWENSGGYSAYQSSYIDYPWIHQYPPDRFWHAILGVPQAEMQATINLALTRNAGWVYVSDSASNGYNQVPVYWTAEAATVEQQGVQAPFAIAWPQSTDSSGAVMNARVSFRWRAVNGAVWQIFLDTDQNALTGYQNGSLSIGAEYMIESNSTGNAQLYRYNGAGTDWNWVAVSANAQVTFPDTGTNLVAFDQEGIGAPQALNYQIHSLDANYNLLYSSYAIPLSLNNTGLVLDIANHLQ
ncbi:MAG: spherulation-specific family 4 protein [Candidatus Acidiferrum sp.]